MRLNAGIITEKLQQTKEFYVHMLDFRVVWESDWFILLSTPNGADTISFLTPEHPTQALDHFKKPFLGTGIYFTIEVDDVDDYHEKIQEKNVPMALDIRSEPWGDRHFAITDPNNIGIDFVTHSPPE